MNLLESLCQRLRQQGEIPFVEFMQYALYAPGQGYYSSGLQKFGVAGDFITAPELTPLFGQTLANQCQQVLDTLDTPVLFEFGAGSGRLCVDILKHLQHLNSLPEAYYILEVSGTLRQRQETLIHTEIPHLASRVEWLSQWPHKPFTGVIIANEVLDAMPVHRFMQTADGLLESYIRLDAEGRLAEIYKPCENERLLARARAVLPPGLYPYQSEANLFLDAWFCHCSAMLAAGAFFILDYGFPQHEYYHPERRQGTLMCHYRHQAHANPLAHPGEEDITAHVDFTHVAEAAYAAGFHVAGYTNQASFLLANGLLSLLASIPDERARFKAQQAAKQLLQESEMGELFKVMALTKNMDMDLHGFQLHDKRASL
ncbi:class I SAM-dependent methyltransferase [Legionella septentrionalis]|uniref:SAM-dependent methyltransferase n=1 Tax=Legionella septentrionalis TaxID=2498109 RepID=A0A3S0VAU0_9GAMM|nr:SAM-dependent methyltransferase [Legionella septentrionalis]RUQ88798.1 SAM-dependent methyltransferase [Legionella septentrionalis]RUR11511.1 SAM-dependent methyltransferase [Legionella septentrionalis]